MSNLLPFILAAAMIPLPILAASGGRTALPAGSRAGASVALGAGERAVAYTHGEAYIGVEADDQRKPTLIWHRRLPFPATSLFPGGEPGSFAGIGARPGGTEGEFFAYRVVARHVRPALSGTEHGFLTASEGVHESRDGVLVRVHDEAHQGSVQYARVTRYRWGSAGYEPVATTLRPDYPKGDLPHPRGEIKTKHGDTILIRLEVANSEQEREVGLMNRTTLDADSGMVFVWSAPVLESFWMENTYIPLTVAFVAPDGTIEEMQDMKPLSTDLHTPSRPYQYAIEVNQGFFARYGIQAGDRVALQLT